MFKRHSKRNNIQAEFLKGENPHNLNTLSSYIEHENLWKPYLIDDVLGLAYIISQHGNSVRKITGVSNRNSLTVSSLAWNCLSRYLKVSKKTFFTPKNKIVRDFIRKTVHG